MMRLPGYRIPLDRDRPGRVETPGDEGQGPLAAPGECLENKEVQARCLFQDPARRALSTVAVTLIVMVSLAACRRRHRRVPR